MRQEVLLLVLIIVVVAVFIGAYILFQKLHRHPGPKSLQVTLTLVRSGAQHYFEDSLSGEGAAQANLAAERIRKRADGRLVLVMPEPETPMREMSEIMSADPSFVTIPYKMGYVNWGAAILELADPNTSLLDREMRDYILSPLFSQGDDYSHLQLVLVVDDVTLKKCIQSYYRKDRRDEIELPPWGSDFVIHLNYDRDAGDVLVRRTT